MKEQKRKQKNSHWQTGEMEKCAEMKGFFIFIFIDSIYELHYDSKYFDVVKVNHSNMIFLHLNLCVS